MKITDLKSAKLLDDCRRALNLLEAVPEGDNQLFKIYWTFCLVTLNRISDVLYKVDGEKFPKIALACKSRFEELLKVKDAYAGKPYSECPQDYLVFWRFVKTERNKVSHAEGCTEFSTVTAIGDDFNFNLGCLYLPFDDIEQMGDLDCRDWVNDAICWWQCELENLVSKVA